jgi:hypothetical protein
LTANGVAPAASLACGGAPARTKAGLGAIYSATSASIGAALTTLTAGPAGALLVGILAAASYDLATLCQAGDPGDQVLTAQDIIDAYDPGNQPASTLALHKISLWFTHLMFPLWCDCVDGTVPPPSTFTAPPVENPSPNMPPASSGANCWHNTGFFHCDPAATQTYANSLLPRTTPLPGTYPPGQAAQFFPTPPPTSLTATVSMKGMPTSSPLWAWDLQFLTSAGTPTSGGSIFSPSLSGDVSFTASATVPADAAGCRFFVANPNPPTSVPVFNATITLFCGTQSPTTPIVPCCPPDPFLEARLTFLTGLVQHLVGIATAPIDALQDGASHGPFTGTGSVLLQVECAAVRVVVLSDLTGHPQNPGTPNYFFSLGFITSYEQGTPLKGWRLVYSGQTFPLQTYADQIGWTLAPGVSIRITELIGVSAPG